MKKVITYGTFDLFHFGHQRLLERAKALGDYLIVGVTTDNFDLERGKMSTCNNVMERIDAVRKTGLADQIIIEEYRGQKIDDIQKYGVDVFAIGSDWEGYFDYLNEYCQVVYLPRTEGISSTQLREERPVVRLGVIGTGSIASRFVPESRFVNSNTITTIYNPDTAQASLFCVKYQIQHQANCLDDFFAHCDAVYVASPMSTHYEYVKQALKAGKHVLCEIPFVSSGNEAKELYQIAEDKDLVLMVALKTAYCPAFSHLITLLKSGAIGEVVEINVSNSTLLDEHKNTRSDFSMYGGSIQEISNFPLLPIFKLLGLKYEDVTFYSKMNKEGKDLFTKAVFRYSKGVASFQVGLGVKTEGNLVVSGTKGYAYVPAPWWKTDYFELRFEDQNQNKKYFHTYAGDGLRYEIKDFISAILSKDHFYSKLSKKENIAMAELQELFMSGTNVWHI